jgi:hypothetical protein
VNRGAGAIRATPPSGSEQGLARTFLIGPSTCNPARTEESLFGLLTADLAVVGGASA